MRHLLIGDIHSNLTAFQAVLEHAKGQAFDDVWCLGDVVGYGPDPNECVELLRSLDALCVLGNHDAAAIGRLSLADFNPTAASAALWTARELAAENRDFLAALPLTETRGDFTIVHGSPREPVWEYVASTAVAWANFAHFEGRYCLVGHSHVPAVFRQRPDGEGCVLEGLPEGAVALGERRLILNPGGVGQPRDGDPRAAYVIVDDEGATVTHYRVPYAVEDVQDRMLVAGLPAPLAERLAYGM